MVNHLTWTLDGVIAESQNHPPLSNNSNAYKLGVMALSFTILWIVVPSMEFQPCFSGSFRLILIG